jgi:hypothetical protein
MIRHKNTHDYHDDLYWSIVIWSNPGYTGVLQEAAINTACLLQCL